MAKNRTKREPDESAPETTTNMQEETSTMNDFENTENTEAPETPTTEAPATTPEEDAAKAKAKARAEKKAAVKFVLETMKGNTLDALGEVGTQFKEALTLVLGRRAMRAMGQALGAEAEQGKKATIRALFKDENSVTELALFMAAKVGRSEMRAFSRYFVKCAADDRLWIDFDPATESWVCQGRGEAAPVGWQGYKPGDAEPPAAAE